MDVVEQERFVVESLYQKLQFFRVASVAMPVMGEKWEEEVVGKFKDVGYDVWMVPPREETATTVVSVNEVYGVPECVSLPRLSQKRRIEGRHNTQA